MALIVGINIINTSVLDNFRRTIEVIAGPAQLEITLGIGEVGFSESALDVVRIVPGVEAAIPLVRGTVSLEDGGGETLQLFGADLTTEEDLERYRIKLETDRGELLSWLNDPHSIALTKAFASQRRVDVGQQIALSTPRGVEPFVVRGLLEPDGMARAFGGQLALMDLPAAQILLGKQGKLDQIDVVVRTGAEVAKVRELLLASLPPTLSVERPAHRGEQYERILQSFQAMLAGFSLLCLVAGVYIIYNTTSTGALHRASAVAGLRLIGADGRQLFSLLIVESIVLGALGALAGIPAGLGLAHALTGMVSDTMGIVFQLRFPVESLSVNTWQLALIPMMGMVVSPISSYSAARWLATLDPLEVLRSDVRQVGSRLSPRSLVALWMLLVLASALALVLEVRLKSIAWGNFGSTLWFASSIVIAIPLISASSGSLSRMLTRLGSAAGRVAGESLFRSPRRTGVTVAAVTLVLTVAIMFASLTESLRGSATRYYSDGGYLVGDIVVSAIATEGGWLETPLPETIIVEIRNIGGVGAVESARALPGHLYRGERVTLLALSDGLLASSHYGPWWYVEGDSAEAARALQAGRGANISTALADRFDLSIGDTLKLDTPGGPLDAPIVGIVRDYMSDKGTITFNRRVLVEHWEERAVNRLSVFLEPGADLEDVRQRIAERFKGRYRLKVLLPHEMVTYHVAHINRAFAFTDAIQLLIIFVTVAGIFDLLIASIWERRRELALWRVIGADDRTVRRSVVIESATIGLLGGVLGVAVGLVTAWVWIGVHFRYLLGYHLEYDFDLRATVEYVVLVIVMTAVAGYAAARYATRQPILDGIQVE